MSWTLFTSGSAIVKAGANANSTITASGSVLQQWADEADAFICDTVRVDVVTNYSTLKSNGKAVLSNIGSSLVAQKIINYDMSGYTSRGEATLMLNVLENEIQRGIKLIVEDKNKSYIDIT